jgi:hypothetical protein
LTSVQKYFKPLIFESKILFKIQKIERVYAAASLPFGPFRRSAHFRLSFTPTETGPLHSTFWPDTSAPKSGFHRLPPPASIGPTAPPVALRVVHRRLPPSSAREEPNQSAIMLPSIPPLNWRHPVSSSPFNSFETDEE